MSGLYRIDDDAGDTFIDWKVNAPSEQWARIESLLVKVEPVGEITVRRTPGFGGTYETIKPSDFLFVDMDGEVAVDLPKGKYLIVGADDE